MSHSGPALPFFLKILESPKPAGFRNAVVKDIAYLVLAVVAVAMAAAVKNVQRDNFDYSRCTYHEKYLIWHL